MLEILKFIFSSFWVWLGTVILLCMLIMTFEGVLKTIIYICRGDKKA